MKKYLFLFSYILISNCTIAQLTSLSFSYGIGGVIDLNKKMKFPSHQAHFDANFYLTKSLSATFNLNYRHITLNQQTIDSIPIPKWTGLSVGLGIKWWFLNDFRLKAKKGSKGKGKLIALTYPFRMYLMAYFGYCFNITNGNPNLERGSLFAGGGLGVNFWQFYPKKKSGVGSGTSKFFIIPFLEIVYNAYFKDYLRTPAQVWKTGNLDFKVGFRIAFDKY